MQILLVPIPASLEKITNGWIFEKLFCSLLDIPASKSIVLKKY
jgi:hypothetical protein